MNRANIGPLGDLRQNQPPPAIKLNYCLYARKSTEQEEKQILSIDSQIKEMLELAQKEGLNITEIKKESHSAKDSGQRQVFNELITDLRSGKFNAVLTWAPDRLSRNAGDLGSLVDLMDQKLLIEIRTYSQRFTNSPNEKFLLMILCSQAKLENDNKSINVKRGMKARAALGFWPGIAPMGYLNENRRDKPGSVIIDPERAPIVKQMFEKFGNDGWSGRKIYTWLKETKFTTKNNKEFGLGNLYLMLRKSFYYGIFEYPQGSHQWYQGQHQPIITKELFDKVQTRLGEAKDPKTYDKEFAFTRLLTCGLCGSTICAYEKFKKLNNGSISRYVYYGCAKGKDVYCKAGQVREEALIDSLLEIIDQVSLDTLGLKEKIEKELEKHSRFRSAILGIAKTEQIKSKSIDGKNYIKYILKEGDDYEKRDILTCLKTKLIFKDKKLQLPS
ncbi:MAG: recombinase family protein [Candidatus Komeilibacteria bacterium]|nr:recombinase family protein [Candidatus Komeilibacteria bacterium]